MEQVLVPAGHAMSVEQYFTRACTLTTPTAGPDDPYGNPTTVDGSPTTTRCYARQARAEERTIGEDLDVTEWILAFPAGDPVTSRTKVNLEDVDDALEVQGQPEPVVNARTGAVKYLACRATSTH